MENSLKCHRTLKNVQTFRAEPFISVKKSPLWQVGIRHTKKLTVKVHLHVTCACEKHSYEIGMCDQECALHACALNKSNVRV